MPATGALFTQLLRAAKRGIRNQRKEWADAGSAAKPFLGSGSGTLAAQTIGAYPFIDRLILNNLLVIKIRRECGIDARFQRKCIQSQWTAVLGISSGHGILLRRTVHRLNASFSSLTAYPSICRMVLRKGYDSGRLKSCSDES